MKSKSSVLFLHGTGGNNQKNWLPWIKKELESSNHKVIIPNMPNSDYPVSRDWLTSLANFKDELNEQSVIVGHSLGCPTAWQFIEKHQIKITELILIAPTHPDMDFGIIQETHTDKKQVTYIEEFTKIPVDWNSVQSLVKKIEIWFSSDDPYIPMSTKGLFERDISANYKVFENMGHFNVSTANMTEFPELLEYIRDNA